jgi:hypothetical protein
LLSDLLNLNSFFKKLLIFSLFLTFSKTAIFTYFLVFILNTSLLQNFLISIVLSFLPFLDINSISLNTRRFILYTLPQFKFQDYLFGIGPKSFITRLPNLYPASNLSATTLQPLHNTPLLILLELGLLPILIIFHTLKFKIKNLKLLLSILLLTGSLDHYWWTLPQNTLSFILTFVLLFRYGLRRNSNTHWRRFSW